MANIEYIECIKNIECTECIECIDCFSGIGGIGLALAPFVKTLLYCEYDKYCQNVLTARMRSNDLDRAPIHSDIKTLHLSPQMKPTMIAGGFPCQDISTAGAQIGMAGNRSSLFFEIMRLVDESPSIVHVFLENVANIVKCGMAEVLEELGKRDFDIVWTTRSAGAMGAPHQRSRWFCLATKRGANPITIPENNNVDKTYLATDPWQTECTQRITLKNDTNDPTWDPNWIARSHCLGNTVVPCVVRSAFLELVGISSRLELVCSAMAPYAIDGSSLAYPYPEAGILLNDKQSASFIPLPAHKQSANSRVDITVVGVEGKLTKMCNYPTLRRGITHPSNITERSLHDLPTVLCNTTVAHEQIRAALGTDVVPQRIQGLVVPNMAYLEWLQGYPADWTKVEGTVPYKVTNDLGNATNTNGMANAANGMANYIDEESTKPTRHAQPSNRNHNHAPILRPKNGMHLFMKKCPGKDVKTVAILWRELTEDVKTEYKNMAADLAVEFFKAHGIEPNAKTKAYIIQQQQQQGQLVTV